MRRLSMVSSATACAMAAHVCHQVWGGQLSVSSSAASVRTYVSLTPVTRFDLRQHEMEKRKRREMEKAGIDPNDDEPWIAPEEQERIDEEEAQRRAEEEERVQQMLAKRADEDVAKRKKFREFRAKQVAMSKQRKEENLLKKTASDPSGKDARVMEEEAEDSASSPEEAQSEAVEGSSSEATHSTKKN